MQLLKFRLVAWVTHVITFSNSFTWAYPCYNYPCNKSEIGHLQEVVAWLFSVGPILVVAWLFIVGPILVFVRIEQWVIAWLLSVGPILVFARIDQWVIAWVEKVGPPVYLHGYLRWAPLGFLQGYRLDLLHAIDYPIFVWVFWWKTLSDQHNISMHNFYNPPRTNLVAIPIWYQPIGNQEILYIS